MLDKLKVETSEHTTTTGKRGISLAVEQLSHTDAVGRTFRTLGSTTNAIESLNSVIRKAIKNRKIFPNDPSALNLDSAVKN